ncbi:hypothetical protein U6S23_07400 [Cutibacterium acnes]
MTASCDWSHTNPTRVFSLELTSVTKRVYGVANRTHPQRGNGSHLGLVCPTSSVEACYGSWYPPTRLAPPRALSPGR